MKTALVAVSLVALALPLGCAAQVGVGGMVSVPRDAPTTCSGYCSDMGMSLEAVVVMASNVGCVCEPKAKSASAEHGASTAGGMAALVVEEESRRQQQSTPH